MVQVIVFDLDYTLYDDTPYWLGVFREVARILNDAHAIDEEKAFLALKRILEEKTYTYRKIFDDAFCELGIAGSEDYASLIQRSVEIYRNYIPSLVLYPGAFDVLKEVKKKYRIALLTNGTLPITERKLKILGIEQFFDCVHCPVPEDRKPSPKPFLFLLEEFGVEGHEMVYIGDNPEIDFPGAKKCGVKTIRITSGPFAESVVSEGAAPDITVRTLPEVPQALEALVRTGPMSPGI
ncbi:MAG: HAD family hydrolase [Bdellovibrionales bacterium]|nr:HAD family hydrolase [Bdellovibrionales bacterium]